MSNKDVMRKLSKILALAERGIGGEKTNAQSALKKMLEKHGLSLEDIINKDEEDLTVEKYRYNLKQEKELLFQLYARLKNTSEIKYFEGQGHHISFKLTPLEHVELKEMFRYFNRLFKEEMSIIVTAFIHKHELYNQSPTDKVCSSDKDLERDLRVQQMMKNMKRSDYIGTRRRLLNTGKDFK